MTFTATILTLAMVYAIFLSVIIAHKLYLKYKGNTPNDNDY